MTLAIESGSVVATVSHQGVYSRCMRVDFKEGVQAGA